MPSRIFFALLLIGIGLTGCSKPEDLPEDEEKSPYFVTGQDLVAAHDYKRALRAFEKALEVNPESALAHYELGLINEQHEHDFVSAIYHYQRALRLRPDSYPADNAKVRIASCKQELVKAELVAPVAQGMVRELDRLKQENTQLRQQLATLQTSLRQPAPERPAERTRSGQLVRGQADRTDGPTSNPGRNQTTPQRSSVDRRSSTTHTVIPGDTAFAIARRYGLSLDALLRANPGLNTRKLAAGQRLRIPDH